MYWNEDWLYFSSSFIYWFFWERHRFVILLIDTFIGCFFHVLWSGIKPTTLVYWHETLNQLSYSARAPIFLFTFASCLTFRWAGKKAQVLPSLTEVGCQTMLANLFPALHPTTIKTPRWSSSLAFQCISRPAGRPALLSLVSLTMQ